MSSGSERRPCGSATARRAAQDFASAASRSGFSEAALQAFAGEPAYVGRLDRPESGYYLVPFYAVHRLRAIVEVDAATCKVAKAAEIRAPNVPFLLDSESALRAAREDSPQLRDLGEPRLGWRPSKESLDSFLPFWVVDHADGRVFVGQDGRVHQRLTTEGLGGG